MVFRKGLTVFCLLPRGGAGEVILDIVISLSRPLRRRGDLHQILSAGFSSGLSLTLPDGDVNWGILSIEINRKCHVKYYCHSSVFLILHPHSLIFNIVFHPNWTRYKLAEYDISAGQKEDSMTYPHNMHKMISLQNANIIQ